MDHFIIFELIITERYPQINHFHCPVQIMSSLI